ncbi:hypothetical protein H0I39_04085 [Ottowia beijingensis]|uniref:Inovirus Gp2 family protein n=1 Tax=Ottowia beijingensis TaxID=1207057 RepID=A0A853IWU8_9BURK|nr:hypothetical protein [Ottowia beijingensis]NZA01148.1 hypothetical protein [Ottowia beijingensis]
MVDIVNAVERIARSQKPLFRHIRTPQGGIAIRSDELGRDVAGLLAMPAHHLRQSLVLYDLDPRVDMFWDEADRRGLATVVAVQPWTDESLVLASVDALNGFVQAVRQRHARKGFQSKVNAHVRATLKNYTALKGYLMAILQLHPRLLPITLDFTYRNGAPSGAADAVPALKIVSSHLASLVENVRTTFGDAVLGHAWSQDAMLGCGNVGHLLLLLKDDIDSNESFALAHEVARSWRDDVTGGDGCAYNNLAANDLRFRFRGISQDERRYTPVEEHLRRMAVYLRWTDRFAALKRSPGVQTHGMGTVPKVPEQLQRAQPIHSPRCLAAALGRPDCEHVRAMPMQTGSQSYGEPRAPRTR